MERLLTRPRRNPATLRVPPGGLVVLCGPAASGKTTWARRLFRASELLSSDGFREMLAGDAGDQSVSGEVFMLLHDIVSRRLRRGLLTVVDSTALETGSRTTLRRLAERNGRRPVVLVVIDVGERTCRARDARRRRRVGPSVIRAHHVLLGKALARLDREPYHDAVVLDAAGARRVRLVRGRT